MQYIEEDKIDLRELWQVLFKRKVSILVITLLVTAIAGIYAFTVKPVYQGSALIEIGEVVNNSKPTTIFYLDNINNLKDIVIQTQSINADVPKKTNNLLRLSYESTDKSLITSRLQTTIEYIFERHQEKAKLYENINAKIRMTQIIGQIDVGENSIKPKKALTIIVAFITGLMLSVFLAFFLEFIQGNREEEEKEAPQDSLS